VSGPGLGRAIPYRGSNVGAIQKILLSLIPAPSTERLRWRVSVRRPKPGRRLMRSNTLNLGTGVLGWIRSRSWCRFRTLWVDQRALAGYEDRLGEGLEFQRHVLSKVPPTWIRIPSSRKVQTIGESSGHKDRGKPQESELSLAVCLVQNHRGERGRRLPSRLEGGHRLVDHRSPKASGDDLGAGDS
jgi:hypothetical protein